MNTIEAAPYIFTMGDEKVKDELYLKYFDVKLIGNLKGSMPLFGVDYDESEDGYNKRLREWRFADREVLFEGWMVKDMKHSKVLYNHDKTISILFEFKDYTITIEGKEYFFPVLPETIDDFINDCKRIGLKLFWKREIIDKFGVEKITSDNKVVEYHKFLKKLN